MGVVRIPPGVRPIRDRGVRAVRGAGYHSNRRSNFIRRSNIFRRREPASDGTCGDPGSDDRHHRRHAGDIRRYEPTADYVKSGERLQTDQ